MSDPTPLLGTAAASSPSTPISLPSAAQTLRENAMPLAVFLALTLLDFALTYASWWGNHQGWNFENELNDSMIAAGVRFVTHVLLAACVAAWLKPASARRSAFAAEQEALYKISEESKLPRVDDSSLAADPKREWERRAHAAQTRERRVFNALLGIAFLVDTATSVGSAVKTVSYDYEDAKNRLLIQVVLCLGVFFANVEFWACRNLMLKLLEERGRSVPTLHNHALFFNPKLPGHWCDGCHTRIVGEGYRCKICNFDACPTCFDKHWRRQTNGQGESNGGKGKKSANDRRNGAKRVVSTATTNGVDGEGDDDGEEENEDEDDLEATPILEPRKPTLEPPTNMTYFLRAMRYGREQAVFLGLSLAALLLSTVASLAMPSFTGKILDSVYRSDTEAFKLNVYRMIASSAMVTVLSVVQFACISVMGRRIGVRVRLHLFQAIMKQDVSFFDAQMTGQLTSRLTGDVAGMVAPWSTIVNTVVGGVLTLAGGLVMCLYTSWKLCALAFASVGPILYVTSLYARWSRRTNNEIYAAFGDAYSISTEALQNIRTVRAFSTEHEEVRKFKSAMDVVLEKSTRDALAGSTTSALTSFVDLATSALILGIGGWTAIHHPEELTAGDLLRFQLYWAMIDSSWRSLNGVVNSLTVAAAAANRVLSLMDSLPEIDLDRGEIYTPTPGSPPDLSLVDVSFRYPSRPEASVLQSVNLRVFPGKMIALCGPSGGGKSTVAALLMRLYDPDSGSVTLGGKDLRSYNLRSVHEHFGYVSQDTQLFGSSVFSNIAYGLPRMRREALTPGEVVEAAKKANIYDEVMRWDEGFDTKIGEKGVRLSGGQRTRLALARAFLRRPAFLLLDEATASLDAANEALVQRSVDALLNEVEGGSTCVVIAHRLSTIVKAFKLYLIQQGRVVESGTHDELLELKDGVYRKLFETQMIAGPKPERGGEE